MYTNQEQREKIQQLYPDICQCDINIVVNWDPQKGVWTVDFKKGERRTCHYPEEKDAVACLEGEKCVGLGIDFNSIYTGDQK
jgi:hypothetical protein